MPYRFGDIIEASLVIRQLGTLHANDQNSLRQVLGAVLG